MLHAGKIHAVEVNRYNASLRPALLQNIDILNRKMPSRVKPRIQHAFLSKRVADGVPFLVAIFRCINEMAFESVDD